MSTCNITPITANKACSGKCKGGSCRTTPRVWVVAACEGMISLFDKSIQGNIVPVFQGKQEIFASLDAFQKSMDEAEATHAFDQLILVGSNNDLAWIQASLTAYATQRIIAEINYPLLPAWFKQPLSVLSQALETVLTT